MDWNGLTARLKRLSDAFLYQTKDFYTRQNAGIEPNWLMIFLLLEEHGQLTVTEMSARLGLSHPALVKLTKKMKDQGYLTAVRDQSDRRQSQLRLSEKAIAELPTLHEYWKAGEKSLRDLMDNSPEFLRLLGVLEQNLCERSFTDRILDNLPPTD